MLEMTTILATLVRDFRFKTTPGHRMELAPTLTTRPKGGLPLMIESVHSLGMQTSIAEPCYCRSQTADSD